MARRKKSRKGSARSGLSSLTRLAAPIAYGYVREMLSDKLSQTAIVQRLPATEFTDEAVMLGTNFILKKVGVNKNPMGRAMLNAQEKIELARIGQTVKDIMTAKAAGGNRQIQQPGLLF